MTKWMKYSEEKPKNSYFIRAEQTLHSFRNMRDYPANILKYTTEYFWNLVIEKFPLSQRVPKNIEFCLERYSLLSLSIRSDNKKSSPGSNSLLQQKAINGNH